MNLNLGNDAAEFNQVKTEESICETNQSESRRMCSRKYKGKVRRLVPPVTFSSNSMTHWRGTSSFCAENLLKRVRLRLECYVTRSLGDIDFKKCDPDRPANRVFNWFMRSITSFVVALLDSKGPARPRLDIICGRGFPGEESDNRSPVALFCSDMVRGNDSGNPGAKR